MNTIRILLADDHVVMRRGIRALLERRPDFQVVAEAGDGREAVELTETYAPHVVVADIAMPNLNGIEAARQIAQKSPQTAIVILSMHSDESYVLRALKAGARGYLLKDYMRQLQQRGADDSYELLTMREREVLQLLAEGKSNKDVAGILNLSIHTVETHRSNI